MFIQDRDLLLLEPSLFRDMVWLGQRLVRGTGTISGTTLTLATQDLTFEAAGVTGGHVLSFDNVGLEVVARLSATTATISRPRQDPDDPPIPPAPAGTALLVEVTTFAPQARLVHHQVLRMLGIDPDDPGAEVTEQAITNPRVLALAEALGTLHLVYAAAGAAQRRDGPINERAEMYRRRFAQERMRAVVRLDLDGDGVADATRRLSVAQISR